MSERKLRLTAYHEAGHAVASWVVGLEMEGASIEPKESSLGRVTLAHMKHMEVYDKILHRRLVSYYAGVKAVELYAGQPTDPDDPNTDVSVVGSDWDAVMDLTLALGGPEESGQAAVQERAEEIAQRTLRENWRGVEAVANALLRHRSLNSENLSRILEETNCPRGEPVYDYELNKLSDRRFQLTHQYHALIEEGRHKDARRIAEEYALVKSKMEDLVRLAERGDK